MLIHSSLTFAGSNWCEGNMPLTGDLVVYVKSFCLVFVASFVKAAVSSDFLTLGLLLSSIKLQTLN